MMKTELLSFIIIGILAISILQQAQATICPIDSIKEDVENAYKYLNEGNYLEVRNSIDLINEAIEMTEDEKNK